jgi:ubiquitin carboxyl-terminal hydrolase 25
LDPERFQGIAANAEQTAPITLDKYLRDVMDGDSSSKPKRIALRNKRFYVQFGEACSALFEYLEFTRLAEDDEQYWTLPSVSSDEASSIGSRRAFFEDAKSEVQSLIDSKIPDEVVKPYPAKGQLQTALRCPPRSDLTSAAEKGQAGDLTVLGVTAKSSSKVLLYAYLCQANTDPRNQTKYLSALQSLANDRQDLDLQLEAVTIESLKDTPQLPAYTTDEPLANAYIHFQLPSDYNDEDDLIVGRYKTYRDNSPAQKLNHRLSLLTIGQARQSKRILDLAYGGMELDEAYQFLEADAAWPTESIAAFAESMVSVS